MQIIQIAAVRNTPAVICRRPVDGASHDVVQFSFDGTDTAVAYSENFVLVPFCNRCFLGGQEAGSQCHARCTKCQCGCSASSITDASCSNKWYFNSGFRKRIAHFWQ